MVQDKMYKVHMYERVRRSVLVDGLSKREAAKVYGINRRTVDKVCKYAVPPGYRRNQEKKYPKLGEYILRIEEILASDLSSPKKQRHTSKRIYDRLREENGYGGGYDSVRRYVSEHRLSKKEVYVPLQHLPGTAQCDFGECVSIIDDKKVELHYFVMNLCGSGDIFAKAYYVEDQVSWCDGHAEAFEHFVGVPKEIVYDNATSLVKKIGKYGHRETTTKFSELKSHYLFESIFTNPARGNEKGIVEGNVGYVRRNFLVPVPKYKSIEELNEYLRLKCVARRNQKHLGHNKSINTLLIEERENLLPLPEFRYECCHVKILKVNSCSLVRYKTNDYSVPTEYAYKDVMLKAYHNKIIIFYKDKEIANHKRLYTQYDQSYNFLHYLPVLLRKTRALDQAKPMQDLDLPKEFEKLREVFEQRYKSSNKGKREYIEVLQLLSYYSQDELVKAIREAFQYGIVTLDSIKQILLRSRDKNIKPIDSDVIPQVLDVKVYEPCLDQYDSLLTI